MKKKENSWTFSQTQKKILNLIASKVIEINRYVNISELTDNVQEVQGEIKELILMKPLISCGFDFELSDDHEKFVLRKYPYDLFFLHSDDYSVKKSYELADLMRLEPIKKTCRNCESHRILNNKCLSCGTNY